jgi:urease accessory protein
VLPGTAQPGLVCVVNGSSKSRAVHAKSWRTWRTTMRLERLCRGVGGAALASLVLTSEAMAHHVMGGEVPRTLTQGLLSGIGHPVIGLDHLAFVLGIGIIAGVLSLGLMLPALYVGFMCVGLALHLATVDIAGVELAIAASVVLVGLAIVWGRSGANRWIEGGLFALAGTLHGYAFAESIVGAEQTPLAAYIAGLVVVQFAIAAIAYAATRFVMGTGAQASLSRPRLAGAVIALTGVYFAASAAGAGG